MPSGGLPRSSSRLNPRYRVPVIGAVALALASTNWIQYLWRIPREQIPRRPWGSLSAAGAGVLLGLWSGSWWGWSAAVLGGYFWFLVFTSGYPSQGGIGVGDEFPAIEAPTADGRRISSADWSGRRILFKLYRGPW